MIKNVCFIVFLLVLTTTVSSQFQKDFDASKHDSLDPQTFLTSMASTFVLITKLIVEFAKCMPGFLTLSKDDQITLLKVSSVHFVLFQLYFIVTSTTARGKEKKLSKLTPVGDREGSF